ncbi:MAG: hypothetical protein P8R42_24665 [Candidatus Binatia bacterium]|nr:hypothetical protein [Candidatus Binatia bacterium]
MPTEQPSAQEDGPEGRLARVGVRPAARLRPLANHPRDPRYDFLGGLLAAAWSLGPLVTPLRLRKTDEPIRFRSSVPPFQIQPAFEFLGLSWDPAVTGRAFLARHDSGGGDVKI